MQEFKDKVAVITGGASGIGLAMAKRFAGEGMKLVLADVEEEALRRVEKEFRKAGVPVLAIRTDVSRSQDVERLAEKTLATFGAVHVVCNNAGVAPGGVVWENTTADWEWVLGVNVWGVIHGVRMFVPIMLRQDTECHVVNTASVAGLLSVPGMGIYCVSKHAVVTLTECLHHDLRAARREDRRVGAVPGVRADRHHRFRTQSPAALRNTPPRKTPEELAREEQMRHAVQSGRITAEQVAEMVFDAITTEPLLHPHASQDQARDPDAHGRHPGRAQSHRHVETRALNRSSGKRLAVPARTSRSGAAVSFPAGPFGG